MRVQHELAPIYDENSTVLILGTMPSPKSREVGFYYGHPQNRFWRVMSELFAEDVQTVEEKVEFLHRHRIALWDVLASCEIKGADDSTIKAPIANDLSNILSTANIKAIFTTGKKAEQLYLKYLEPQTGIKAIPLPSTSGANCRFYTYQDILIAYEQILVYSKKIGIK